MVGQRCPLITQTLLMLAWGGIAGGHSWAENPRTQQEAAAESMPIVRPGESLEPHLDEAALAKSVEQLASSEFVQRRQAFLQLWRAGKRALPHVALAQNSSTRPVAEAAAVLQILIDLEIAPERLAESARLLDAISDPSPATILELCKLKYWNVAERIVAANPGLATEFQDGYGRYMLSRIVDAAVEQEQVALAWPIIRQVVSPPQAVWISYKTGLELARSDPYSIAQRLFYEGDGDAALQQKIPMVAQVPMLTRLGRWERMVDDSVIAILAGRRESASQVAAKAVLYEVAGQFQRARELWDSILDQDPPAAGGNEAAPLAMPPEPTGEIPPSNSDADSSAADDSVADMTDEQLAAAVELLEAIDRGGLEEQANKNQLLAAMIFSGRVAAVGAYLEKHDPNVAFSFYLAGNQATRAFEALGLQADLSNFDNWFARRKLLIAEQLSQRGLGESDFDQCARLCGVLADLGHRQQSQGMLQQLVELARLSRGKQTELWSRSILTWLGRAESRQMALQAAQNEFPRMSSECQAAVLRGLFPEFEDTAIVLWKTAPNDAEGSKWRDLQRLYVMDQSAFEADGQRTVEAWLRRALNVLHNDQLNSEHLLTLAEIASGFGNRDLATEILLTELSPDYGQSSSANLHWAQAARFFIQQGQLDEALRLLSQVRRTGVNPMRPYFDEVRALMLSGKFAQAQTLEQARWLRPLATVIRYQGYNYFMAARELVDEHQYRSAAEVAEAAFLLADLGSIDLHWSAGLYGDVLEELDDHQRRADVLRAAWVESMQPFASSMQSLIGQGYHSALRFSAQKEKTARAISCVQRQDWEGFRHTVAVARQLQSQDIEVVCQCYPLLRDQGQMQLADQLFNDYEQEMLQQLARWPQDATALNNLAWMYSQCDLKLDEARQLSRRAVELAPSSAVFLDTLAEIEFRDGDAQAALQIMRDCVRLDPREPHYRENLERFRKSVRVLPAKSSS